MLEDYKDLQPIAYKIFKNSVIKNKNSHAYLIETKGNPNGLNLALAFSKYLMCPKKNTSKNNCENCTICKRIEDGNFTEIKIIEPSGMWIKKEQLAELQEEFSKKSIESNKKIYIINHADKLNTQASNSILKFLEEPEENIVAILLTDNIYQLLNTIISRCQIISLSQMKEKDLIKHYDIKNETIFKIASVIENDEQDIINFINDEKWQEKLEKIVKFILFFENNGKDTLLHANKLLLDTFKESKDLIIAFEIIELFYKDIINYLLNRPIEVMNDFKKEIEQISLKNDIISASRKLDIIIEEGTKIKINANNNLLMDKLIIRLMEVK